MRLKKEYIHTKKWKVKRYKFKLTLSMVVIINPSYCNHQNDYILYLYGMSGIDIFDINKYTFD